MENHFETIIRLLKLRARYQTILDLTPRDGSIEIKEISDKKYLYVRKREEGKKTSIYVGPYSEDAYQNLINEIKEARSIKKAIKAINRKLAIIGYSNSEISSNVSRNIDYIQNNLKSIIYNQAVFEGVKITFKNLEYLIENRTLKNITFKDAIKVLNLKRVWELLLDEELMQVESSFEEYGYIAKLVNENVYQENEYLVDGTFESNSFLKPDFDDKNTHKETVKRIIEENEDPIDAAIELTLYLIKTQGIDNSNINTSFIFANHYLIKHGEGLMIIPKKSALEFKKLLNKYLEDSDTSPIKSFIRTKCYFNID